MRKRKKRTRRAVRLGEDGGGPGIVGRSNRRGGDGRYGRGPRIDGLLLLLMVDGSGVTGPGVETRRSSSAAPSARARAGRRGVVSGRAGRAAEVQREQIVDGALRNFGLF